MATKSDPKRRPNPRAEARKAAERRQRIILLIAGIAIVLLAVGVAIASSGESGDRVGLDDVARDVEVSGSLPQLDDPAQDPVIGDNAPTASGVDFAEQPVEIGTSGRPQLITFMASWCGACQQELPEVAAWLDDGRLPEEVDLIAVATSHNPGAGNWPPQDWFEEVGYSGPVLVDDADSSVAAAYGLSGTPFWVAVDADGQVVHRSAGLLPMEQLDALAAELAAG